MGHNEQVRHTTSSLSKQIYFAGAAIVSSFVLACWTRFSYYETDNWERFFFVIGGGTAGLFRLATIAFRGRPQPRFARTAVIVLLAAALTVIGLCLDPIPGFSSPLG